MSSAGTAISRLRPTPDDPSVGRNKIRSITSAASAVTRARDMKPRRQLRPRSTYNLRRLMGAAQSLVEAIEPRNVASLRDRAIIGIMGYAQASIDVVIAMRVRDYYSLGGRRWIRLQENEIERREIVDRRLESYIDAYLEAAGIADVGLSPLFSINPPQAELSVSADAPELGVKVPVPM